MMKLTTLPGGMRVASRDMPGFETVAVGLYADAGARNEAARLNGIAHLFEHMVFKGAGGRSARQISEAIEDVGGDLNAATDREGTNFSATLLAEHLPLGIELLADMIQRPHFDAAELEREKEVVLQELGDARDTPSDIIFDDLWMTAFPDQPLGRPVLGDEKSVKRISVDDLNAWRTDHYRSGSLILAAAGKVDHDALVEQAAERFADLPTGTSGASDPATFGGGRRASRAKGADQAHLTLAFPGVATRDPAIHAARLFTDIVGTGASSRLFQAVREERGLAYSVWCSLQSYDDTGIFYSYAATSRRQAAAAADLVSDVIAGTAKDATQRELDRAKAQSRAGLMMNMESSWGQANYLARMLSTYGELLLPADYAKKIEAVTLDEVRAAGAAMLAGPQASASIGVPAVKAA